MTATITPPSSAPLPSSPTASPQTAPLAGLEDRDWSLSTKDGWFAMVNSGQRSRPARHTAEVIAAMPRVERLRYDAARAAWHANLGPIRTPAMDQVFDQVAELVGANQQDGEKVKPAAVLDALPGLGKTTCAVAFGRAFHREQLELFGPTVPVAAGTWQRVPVAYLSLTSATTMRSLNAMLCRFYGIPGANHGNAAHLANKAADCVANCKTRLIVVDDVHFLDLTRRDGREVANHFKWLANTFPVTFLFVGVGLTARGLLQEGLSAADAALSQTARRWSVLGLDAFEIRTAAGRRTWRKLLLGVEQDLVLANAWRGMVATDLADYLFARSSGHFASLMSLVNRGCYRAIKTGAETLTAGLLDAVSIDAAAERTRRELRAAFDTGVLTTSPTAGDGIAPRKTPAADKPATPKPATRGLATGKAAR